MRWNIFKKKQQAEPKAASHSKWGADLVRAAALDAGLNLPELRSEFCGAYNMGPVSSVNSRTRRRITDVYLTELSKNCFLRGIITAHSNTIVGTGARLQMQRESGASPGDNDANRDIERAFARWAKCIDLGGKTRLLSETKTGQGESFGVAVANPRLIDKTGVGLDLHLLEGAMVEGDLHMDRLDEHGAGGITYDEYGNPETYPIRRSHPSDRTFNGNEVDTLDAEFVFHLFKASRPGQPRGISEVLPALPLFALHRRMQLATVGVIESAANVTAVIESDIPEYAYQDGAVDVSDKFGISKEDAWETFDITNRMMMCIPAGGRIKAFPAGQPNSQYDQFERSIIREIARCLNMPFNIAAGDSSGYNFASGRLDHQVYKQQIAIERKSLECRLLDPLFELWLKSYLGRKAGIAPEDVDVREYQHKWAWDAQQHIDPLKEAKAARERVRLGLTSLTMEVAEGGEDVEEVHADLARDLGFGEGPEAVEELRKHLASDLLGIQEDAEQSEQIEEAVQAFFENYGSGKFSE